ncbi:protein unc-93 homolog A-like [Styela clava]
MSKTSTKRAIRKLWISFFLYSFGVFMIYSAYGTLLSLQSSINVVDGLGTFTVAIIYGTAVFFTLFCVPPIYRRFGAKKCVCWCEITYVIYTIANIYPTFYTMVPASFIVGMGDCMLWSCMPLLNSFFSKRYTSITGKSAGVESRFSGYFYGIFQMSKISGNVVSYTVLYAFNLKSIPEANVTSANTEGNSSIFVSEEILPLETIDYQHCGANDCQNATIVSNSLGQYVPASKLSIYMLMSILTLLCVAAIIIHVIFIPDTGEHGMSRRASKASNLKVTEKDSAQVDGCNDRNNNDETDKKNVNKDSTNGCTKTADANLIVCEEMAIDPKLLKRKIKQSKSNLAFTISTLKDVVKHIINLKQLLMTPIILYTGLTYGFLTSELTRSYSSCVFGVASVPIHMTFYGIGATIVSIMLGKFGKNVHRTAFFIIAMICDGTIYAYALIWSPTSDTSYWSVIPMYLILGGMQGIWVSNSQVVQIKYFPHCLDVACSVWNVWFMLGIATQFAWSTSFCVSTKIYIQIGVLILSMIGYAIAEILHRRQLKSQRRPHGGEIGEESKKSPL